MIVDRGGAIAVDGATGTGGTVVLVGGGNTAIDGAISATGAVSGGICRNLLALSCSRVGDQASVDVGPGGTWLHQSAPTPSSATAR